MQRYQDPRFERARLLLPYTHAVRVECRLVPGQRKHETRLPARDSSPADRLAALGPHRWPARVDRFIAISKAIAARIKDRYRRDSEIIYPPVGVDSFTASTDISDYFLVVSRLAPYKRIDLAVAACTKLGLPLKVVGSGRDSESLRSIAGPTVEFLGQLDDGQVKHHLARCKALIFPGEEDFGIVPVEAQASGRPVVAYGAGGALETIVEGRTGEFFDKPTVDSLTAVLSRFDDSRYSPREMNANAQRFGEAVFTERFVRFVETARSEHEKARSTGGAVASRAGG